MRVVQRVWAEKMNANKHKRKKVEIFTEARLKKKEQEKRVPSSWHCRC